ncbi:hypothetical protein GN958_ATG21943 [Phytophthora infestans]|uniref:Uncharacterized protein n=1 Tax=Phytophthora infestans TaxID=4787 RepID=A0A8S9TMH6_PHYIN|nr:hypothetical protein GN958_ATG21943 [Phytophthora infestans]
MEKLLEIMEVECSSRMTDSSASPNKGLKCSATMRMSLHEYCVTVVIACDDGRLRMTPAPAYETRCLLYLTT